MIRRYLLNIALLSLLMTFVLTVGVITSSILDVVLRAYGISESTGLSTSLILLITLLISGVKLLPPSLLRSVKVLYLQDHTVFEQAHNDKAFKSIAKKMGIFIAFAFISIIIIWLTVIFFGASGG